MWLLIPSLQYVSARKVKLVPSQMRVPCFKDGNMEGKPAMYLGRIVSKENFRAFIYAPDGRQRLVESWDEFEGSMQSGLWFASAREAQAIQKPKPRARLKKEEKVITLELREDAPEVIEDELAFEVTDDFLPKA